MKIVRTSELAIVSGKGAESFAMLRGGRVFVWPLIHRFFKMDLRPRTTLKRAAISDTVTPMAGV
jgi:flotillin